jgi:hypothetical protein
LLSLRGRVARTFQHNLGAFGIGLGLIPNGFEAGNAFLQRRVPTELA